jgi:hypothetical protein
MPTPLWPWPTRNVRTAWALLARDRDSKTDYVPLRATRIVLTGKSVHSVTGSKKRQRAISGHLPYLNVCFAAGILTRQISAIGRTGTFVPDDHRYRQHVAGNRHSACTLAYCNAVTYSRPPFDRAQVPDLLRARHFRKGLARYAENLLGCATLSPPSEARQAPGCKPNRD